MPDQQYTLAFRDRAELREMWSRNLSGGYCLLPTATPFPLQTELQLIFQVHKTKAGLVLRARVIQHLQPEGGKSGGMVVEFLYLDQVRASIDALVETLDAGAWNDLRDFSKRKAVKPADRKAVMEILAEGRRICKEAEHKNWYDVLGTDRAAGAKELRDLYYKRAERFHPDRYHEQVSEEETLILEKALQATTQAYDLLKDSEKRLQYDFASGTVARYRDESKESYDKKMHRWMLHKAGSGQEGTVAKAKRLFDEALAALAQQDLNAAITNLKLAVMHDPKNAKYKAKLDELKKLAPQVAGDSHEKLEDLLKSKKAPPTKGAKP